jgi:hypothetical protein
MVYKVKNENGKIFAMKKIFKTSLMLKENKQVNEIEMLMRVCHPNIV